MRRKQTASDGLAIDQRGATIVEFAIIMLPMCMLLMGSLELGYRVYAQSIVVGALREAARMASTGQYDGKAIDTKVMDDLHHFRNNASISITKRSYSDFTGVGMPEPPGVKNSSCYMDINNNNQYDKDQGTSGLGGAEDVIYYEVSFSYDTLFPISINKFGFPKITKITTNTIVSNEPFSPKSTSEVEELCNNK